MKALFFASLFLPFCLFSQSTKNYDLSDFEEIDVSGAFTVLIEKSDAFKVEVSCEEKYFDKVEVGKSGNELKIKAKSMRMDSPEGIQINIALPSLKNLDISGACDVKLVGMTQDNMEIDISGASSLKGDLDVSQIEIDASGASSIGFSGRANKMNLYLSGASEFKGKGFLITDEFLADFSGASSANCQVDGDMFIKLSGASSLEYHGSGNVLKQETSGSSSVVKN